MFCPLCGRELVLTGVFPPLPGQTVREWGGFLCVTQVFAVQCPGCAGSVQVAFFSATHGSVDFVEMTACRDGGKLADATPRPPPLRFVMPPGVPPPGGF